MRLTILILILLTLGVLPVMAGDVPAGDKAPTIATIAGDVNSSGMVTGTDVQFLVNYLLRHGHAPSSLAAGDANGDCRIDLRDITYLAQYLKGLGAAPRAGSCQ